VVTPRGVDINFSSARTPWIAIREEGEATIVLSMVVSMMLLLLRRKQLIIKHLCPITNLLLTELVNAKVRSTTCTDGNQGDTTGRAGFPRGRARARFDPVQRPDAGLHLDQRLGRFQTLGRIQFQIPANRDSLSAGLLVSG
jgi:hypothetical protein